MNFSQQKHLLAPLVILALFVVSYFIWQDLNYNGPEKLPETAKNDLEIRMEKEGISLEAGGDTSGLAIEKIELKIPDLDRPGKTSAEIQKISKILKGNYDYPQGWLQLGILRKQIGDYDGAIEAWNFAGVIRPNIATSFLNLADLYAYYLKDRPKAEKSFHEAIKAEPQNGFAYYQTANFYRDMLQDEGGARKILEQGISAGADSTGDLQSFLNSL